MDRDRFEISVDDVLKTTKGEHLCGPLCSFNGIATDTRMMGQGQLFIPLTGENFDGHEYLSQARQKGALGALVSGDFDLDDDTLEAFETDFVLIRVKDTHQALLDIAALWRRTFSDLTVIAVTGTDGKDHHEGDAALASVGGRPHIGLCKEL
ncbi:MAG: Mur ligase domain-containing protein [Planctomycetota bacterium]|nr:Mur ligase domain-containing protein [Planctomycetota bacterium]